MPTRKKTINGYAPSYYEKYNEALRHGSARVECGSNKMASTVSREFYNLRDTLRDHGARGDNEAAILAAKYESIKISREGSTLILWNVNAESFQ